MLKVILLRKKFEALQKEEAQLRATQAGFATREADLAAQVEAATTDEEIAAATAAVAALEESQKTTRERLGTIKDEADAILAEIDAAEAAAAAAGVETPAEARSAVRSGAAFQRRCQEFQRTGHMRYSPKELLTRASVSATTTKTTGVVGPTGVSGINDQAGSTVSSFIDMITVTDCTGLGTYKVALVTGDPEATAGSEGTVPNQSATGFKAVELVGKLYNLIDFVSKQIRKFSPLKYEEKIYAKITAALRRVLNKMATEKVLASAQNTPMNLTAASGAALFTPNLLSDIILAYGGDEGVDGAACLVLPKEDLKAFAAVRGKNEYLPVYSIIPDAGNTSVGVIKDNNGLSCRYCLNKNVPALSTATLSSKAIKGMFYGNPQCAEMGLWGEIEVDVNEGYKFGEGLLTVAGEVTADAEVTVQNGFVVVTATKSA